MGAEMVPCGILTNTPCELNETPAAEDAYILLETGRMDVIISCLERTIIAESPKSTDQR